MAPEGNHPRPPSSFKANYGEGDLVVTADEKGEVLMDLKPPPIGKPPRHRMSSSQLSSAVELVRTSFFFFVFLGAAHEML